MNVNRLVCLFVFISISSKSIAQKDSLYKNRLSTNIAAALMSGEAGLYYDYRLSNTIGFQLSYGHRFYNFNIIENGGPGAGYKYFAQQGDIIRLGGKLYFMEYGKINRTKYATIRLSYWNLHTPKYTNRDGPNGINSTPREIVSEDKNVLNIAAGMGKEINLKKTLFIDLFLSFGLSMGEKNTHKYSVVGVPYGSYIYPPNTFLKTAAVFPTIEFGFKVGFGW
jgi:hypothetical protein